MDRDEFCKSLKERFAAMTEHVAVEVDDGAIRSSTERRETLENIELSLHDYARRLGATAEINGRSYVAVLGAPVIAPEHGARDPVLPHLQPENADRLAQIFTNLMVQG